jgi:hypothetical protein
VSVTTRGEGGPSRNGVAEGIVIGINGNISLRENVFTIPQLLWSGTDL